MSLRLRLTLLYTGVLSGVILLLGIIVYALFSGVLVKRMDDQLFQALQQVLQSFGFMFGLVGLAARMSGGYPWKTTSTC